LEYDFTDPASFVEGEDYEAAGGIWQVENGRLAFNSRHDPSYVEDSKIKFLKSGNMTNCIIEMDIEVTDVYQGGADGNAGMVLHMGQMGLGGDRLDGFYVAAGKRGDNTTGNFHWESSWFGMYSGWHDLNNKEDTGIPFGERVVHLVVKVVDGHATITTRHSDGRDGITVEGDTADGRGAPPSYGSAGFRAWQCAGFIDNVKITNIGEGLDFAE
jgi:hypothetical protein